MVSLIEKLKEYLKVNTTVDFGYIVGSYVDNSYNSDSDVYVVL